MALCLSQRVHLENITFHFAWYSNLLIRAKNCGYCSDQIEQTHCARKSGFQKLCSVCKIRKFDVLIKAWVCFRLRLRQERTMHGPSINFPLAKAKARPVTKLSLVAQVRSQSDYSRNGPVEGKKSLLYVPWEQGYAHVIGAKSIARIGRYWLIGAYQKLFRK